MTSSDSLNLLGPIEHIGKRSRYLGVSRSRHVSIELLPGSHNPLWDFLRFAVVAPEKRQVDRTSVGEEPGLAQQGKDLETHKV
jgi:hypothetical protein